MSVKLAQALTTAISYVFSALPVFVRNLFGDVLAFWVFAVLRFRRRLVDKNIKIAFPQMTHKERKKLAWRSLREFSRNIVEFLLVPQVGTHFIKKHCEIRGFENYQNALKKSKGVLLMSLHLGNGDLGITVMSMSGVPVHIISKKFSFKWANDFWFGLRRKKGMKFIEPHGARSSFEILKALKANESVLFVIDQFMGAPFGKTANFFGEPTGTPMGLAVFHLKTEAPVVPVYTYRKPDGTTVLQFDPEIPLEKKNERDETVSHMVDVYNHHLERIISHHPTQWMWIHNRWKRLI